MASFAYVARDRTGKKISGVVDAESPREAQSVLTQKDLFPVSVTAQQQGTPIWSRRVSPQVVCIMYGQLAALLRSGVSLLRALTVLKQQTSHAGLREILLNVHNQVEEGATLAEAMARHQRVFGEMAVSMVRAGSEGGFLEEALDRVAAFTERQQDLKSRTIGALAYPAFLVIMGTGIVSGLIVFVVPRFETLFAKLRDRGQLPPVTDWLLNFSAIVGQWWWVAAILSLFGIILLRRHLATRQGRRQLDAVSIRLPMAGGIVRNLAVARFCRVLGILLRNGVPIIRSLSISADATGNRLLAEAIEDASENISSGESLASPLAASGHFPADVVEMISVAEEANNLETVLVDIAETLERRTWRKMDLAIRLIEPIVLLVLASVVLVIAVALLLPVMRMGSTL